ncbi:hypothetical protein BJ508DRAFT_363891, partial [Ascobolus immersus RN42]
MAPHCTLDGFSDHSHEHRHNTKTSPQTHHNCNLTTSLPPPRPPHRTPPRSLCPMLNLHPPPTLPNLHPLQLRN